MYVSSSLPISDWGHYHRKISMLSQHPWLPIDAFAVNVYNPPLVSLSLSFSSNHLRVFPRSRPVFVQRNHRAASFVPSHSQTFDNPPLFGLVAAGDGEGVEDVGAHDVDHVCRENNPGTAEKSS